MKQPTYQVPNIYAMLKNSPSLSEGNPPVLRINVPGSKSITNRALLLATLAQGHSLLKNVLFSDDSRHFLKCIQTLGFETNVDEQNKTIQVTGHGGAVPKPEAELYVGSAGTAARFLTAYLGVLKGTYHMDASEQMRRRPMSPLLDSLKTLGCEVLYSAESASGTACCEGYFPFTLQGHGFLQNHISIDINHSSQFLKRPAHCLLPVGTGFYHSCGRQPRHGLHRNDPQNDGILRCGSRAARCRYLSHKSRPILPGKRISD